MIEFRDSKTYQKILDHRRNCSKWGKEFCLECFGRGLTETVEMWEQEKATRFKP